MLHKIRSLNSTQVTPFKYTNTNIHVYWLIYINKTSSGCIYPPKCDKIVYCNNLFFRELWRKSGRDSCINIHNLKSTKWAELCFSMPLFSCSLQRQSCALKHNNLMVESTTVQQLRNTGKEGWTFTDVILIMHLILVTRSKYYFSKNRNSLEYKVELLTILL